MRLHIGSGAVYQAWHIKVDIFTLCNFLNIKRYNPDDQKSSKQ